MTARALAASFIAVAMCIPAFARNPEKVDVAGATVLCYHIVESPQDPRMEISRETFLQQMRYLEMTGYTVIPLRDAYEYAVGKRSSLPRNAVVVTIDDGWRSTYTEVFPEMKKRKFPFTVFVYPNIIGKTSYAMTWKQIREMSDAGVDIQSHSFSHPFLTRKRHASVDDQRYAAWLERELAESKRTLERQTGKPVEFIAYPYGDYDSHLIPNVARAGYNAALTCDFGRVKKHSDPLRMKRVVIDKKMDFATFRRFLGAGSMQLEEMTPQPGQILDALPDAVTVTAKIPNHQSVDPSSVGMALLSIASTVPYSYDPANGSVTITVKEALKGSWQRALVWAIDAKSGKRLEGVWTFRLPQAIDPTAPVVAPAEAAPAATGGSVIAHGNATAIRANGSAQPRGPK
jgi:peptidoglycan/xylan/chitin deacetylase (PgdA/CDA1 family)